MVYSSVKVRCEKAEYTKKVRITSSSKPEISNDIITKWQGIVDVLAKNFGVASAVVTRIETDVISVFIASKNEKNPLKVGNSDKLHAGLYCESTIGINDVISIPNALTNSLWDKNPQIQYNLIAYLGIPIKWTDGEIYGTLCMLDNKENSFNQGTIEIIELIKDSIEKDLQILYDKDRRGRSTQYRLNLNKRIRKSNSNLISYQEDLKAEKKAIYNKKLKCDNVKNEFISNISHELRTPLNVILSTIQLIALQHHKNPQANYDINKYIKCVKQNCYRLLRLVNNIIEFTRLEGDFYEMNYVNVDIVSLVKNIILSITSLVYNKGLFLEFKSDVEERIIALDMDKFETILLNLLSNAVKFTDEGDTIYVIIKNHKNGVAITIKDTGIGIPSEKHTLIFERYKQIDKPIRRSYEGSGIGLSLVKLLVEKHEGSISLHSEFGKGSEFVVSLPDRVLQDETVYTSQENNFDSKGNYANSIDKVMLEFSDIYDAG